MKKLLLMLNKWRISSGQQFSSSKCIVKLQFFRCSNNILFHSGTRESQNQDDIQYCSGYELLAYTDTSYDTSGSEISESTGYSWIRMQGWLCVFMCVIILFFKINVLKMVLQLSHATYFQITDFGLSQWKSYSRQHTSHNKSHTQGGTVTHIPPEVWEDCNYKADAKCDVYAMGILLWEIVTEKVPFEGNNRVHFISITLEINYSCHYMYCS